MPKLTFIVGPIGGGIAEISGQLAEMYRDRSLPTNFEFPEEYANGVLMRYVSEYAQGGIEESRHMCGNNLTFDFERYKVFLQDHISRFTRQDRLVIGGSGLSLYISQFKNLYPDAEIVFVKRKISSDALAAVIDHTLTPEMCWCGVEHEPLKSEVLTYVENLNTNIVNQIDALVSELGYNWTTKITGGINTAEKYIHNDAAVMAPIQLVWYKPT